MSPAALNPRNVALDCLRQSDVERKLEQTWQAAQAIAHADDLLIDAAEPTIQAIPEPGRPPRPLLVAPRELQQRKLHHPEGRAALVHAVAHIEFNAINLAWDAVYRFPGMPEGYYRDWASVAADEARHFELLRQRLQQLGHDYGDFPAHDGLWSMAVDTASDCLLRMALVPRVLEARGLDVTPGMIERLRAAGDLDTVEILRLILREEIRHVEIGSRWFRWLCEQRGCEPQPTFLTLLSQYGLDRLRGPLNVGARLQAGFEAGEIAALEAWAGPSQRDA